MNEYTQVFLEGYGDAIFLEDYSGAMDKVFEAFELQTVTEADENKKSMWNKVCEFVSKVIDKIKELVGRFIDWISNKIVSNDSFIAKYKNASLGSIEVEAYDYEAAFKRLVDNYNVAQETFNLTNKAVKQFIETDSLEGQPDEVREKIDEIQREFDKLGSKYADAGALKKQVIGREHEKRVRAKYAKSLLGPKTKRTLDGKKLLAILESNKDIKNTLQKITIKFMDALKFGYKSAKKRQNDIIFGEYLYYRRQLLFKICDRCSYFSTEILHAAQTLIMDLRKNIAACAKGSQSE